jgi:hypothetical protein
MSHPHLHFVTNSTGNDALTEHGWYTFQGRLSLDQIFTQREVRLVKHLQDYCREVQSRPARDVRAMLDSGIRGLAAMAMYFSTSPPLWGRSSLGGKERSGATLVSKLLEVDEHALEWSLPTKAILSRSFGIAKVNFCIGGRQDERHPFATDAPRGSHGGGGLHALG